jgi:hypothetical protein
MDFQSIQETFASALVDFPVQDHASLVSSLEATRSRLLGEATTSDERDSIHLMYHLTCLTAGHVKGVSVIELDSVANLAFDYIETNPARFVVAIAGHAGQCKSEGHPELGRTHLGRAVHYMDAGNHWSSLAPEAEPAIRRQLKALEHHS